MWVGLSRNARTAAASSAGRPTQPWAGRIVLAMAAASVLVAGAVIVGWTADSALLKSIAPGMIAMQPLTAIGFGLSGLALAAACAQLRLMARLAALPVLFIGSCELAAYATGSASPLDLLFFSDAVQAQVPLPVEAGRPGYIVCIVFVLLGAALMLVNARTLRLRVTAMVLASLATMASLTGVTAYAILNGKPLHVLNGALDVSLHGALMGTGLGVATLILCRDIGWLRLLTDDGRPRRIARTLAPLAATPAAIAFIANIGVTRHLYEVDVRMLLIVMVSAVAILMLSLWASARLEGDQDVLFDLAAAFDLSPVFVRSPEGTIEHWPRGCEALYGWSAQQAVGRNVHELLHTVFPQPLDDLNAALRRDGVWRGELVHRTRGGAEKWVSADWVVEERGAGLSPRVVETASDITEIRRLDAERAEGEERIAQAVAAYGLGIFDYYPQAGHSVFSAELERMLGLPRGGLGNDINQLYAMILPEDAERSRAEGQAASARRLPQRGYTVRVRRADGDVRNIQGVLRYLYDDEGMAEHVISINMDITDQVRDREALAARDARLMELQSELTHVSRLSAMGEMAAALAHELNQPLTAAGNFLGAIEIGLRDEKKPLDAKARQRIRDAAQLAGAQTQRAGDIIRRLREFIARGEADTRVEALDLLIDDAVALALPNPSASGVDLRRVHAPDGARVLADRVQVQQVLVNLVRNANEAMQGCEGPHVLTIAAKAKGGMVEIAVTDNGPGVDPAVAAKLFTPFVSTKRTGMGVGLSICRRIIEAHGGRMWMEKAKGVGGDFRFTLPLADGEGGHVEV